MAMATAEVRWRILKSVHTIRTMDPQIAMNRSAVAKYDAPMSR
jgi:hypothetical protein